MVFIGFGMGFVMMSTMLSAQNSVEIRGSESPPAS